MTYAAAVIGTGRHPDEGGSGFAMGYRHGEGYAEHPGCELVACADLVVENARGFADEYGIDDDGVYEDHREMLDAEEVDVVSVCTPPASRPGIVVDCARAGVEAIHAEKPMATTWGECRLALQECSRRGVQLTVNHQLRVTERVRRATELLESGEIGRLERVEASRGDLLEAGIHQLDLCSHFAGDVPAGWVLGGIDYREEQVKYGLHVENQAVVQWAFENGVHGLAATGFGADAIGAGVRLRGTDGTIELGGQTRLRVRRGGEWETIDVEGGASVVPAIAHVVDALDAGEEPLLSARRALVGHEIAFATYESVRRRGRVDLPLAVEDNPLEAMVESGDLSPE